jgi:hypothetical protein
MVLRFGHAGKEVTMSRFRQIRESVATNLDKFDASADAPVAECRGGVAQGAKACTDRFA